MKNDFRKQVLLLRKKFCIRGKSSYGKHFS